MTPREQAIRQRVSTDSYSRASDVGYLLALLDQLRAEGQPVTAAEYRNAWYLVGGSGGRHQCGYCLSTAFSETPKHYPSCPMVELATLRQQLAQAQQELTRRDTKLLNQAGRQQFDRAAAAEKRVEAAEAQLAQAQIELAQAEETEQGYSVEVDSLRQQLAQAQDLLGKQLQVVSDANARGEAAEGTVAALRQLSAEWRGYDVWDDAADELDAVLGALLRKESEK